MKEEANSYWVAVRVKGGRWVRTGPFRNSDEAKRDREDSKRNQFEVDIYRCLTAAQMDSYVAELNGGDDP